MMNDKKFDKYARDLIKKQKQTEISDEFINFSKLRQWKSKIKKVKVKYILGDSLFNLKPDRPLFFKNNQNILLRDLNLKEDIHLFKTKGKREYREGDYGGNRVFFIKNFPQFVPEKRDWVWARVTEINLKKAIKNPNI